MKTKKQILILSTTIILILIGITLIYWRQNTQNIRKEVLGSLKESLEFCEIVKDNINIFSRQGEFWLICNQRPFYAIYENGGLKTELNGWSFLKKDPDLWKELENCDFYDSRDSELIFYCPYDFGSKPLAKYYKFNISSLEIIKIKEENFQDLISDDIKKNYPFLSNCIVSDFAGGGGRGYFPFADIAFNCGDYSYIVKTNFGFLVPPILIEPELEDEERTKLAFEKSFGITPIVSDSTTALYQFNTCQLSITYPPLTDLNQVWVEIKPIDEADENIKNVLIEVGKYFLFPPIDIKNAEFISQETNKLYYKIDGVAVEVIKFEGNNIIMQRVGERYYENR